MNDVPAEVEAEATEPKTSYNLKQLLEHPKFLASIVSALKDYQSKGGDLECDEVNITILVNNDFSRQRIGVGCAEEMDLQLFRLGPSTITIERKDFEPIKYEFSEAITVGAALSQLDIKLGDNEIVWDEDDDQEVALDKTLSPLYDDGGTFCIKQKELPPISEDED